MAYQELMNWNPRRKSWYRMEGRKPYEVSARKLGYRGKEESREAANAYWRQIEEEVYKQRQGPEQWAMRAIEAATRGPLGKTIPTQFGPKGSFVLAPDLIPHWPEYLKTLMKGWMFGRETVEAQATLPLEVMPPVDEVAVNETVKFLSEKWLKSQEIRVNNGKINPPSYAAYRIQIREFVAWIGAETSVKTINSEIVEKWLFRF